jgi:hypothetical protein
MKILKNLFASSNVQVWSSQWILAAHLFSIFLSCLLYLAIRQAFAFSAESALAGSYSLPTVTDLAYKIYPWLGALCVFGSIGILLAAIFGNSKRLSLLVCVSFPIVWALLANLLLYSLRQPWVQGIFRQ